MSKGKKRHELPHGNPSAHGADPAEDARPLLQDPRRWLTCLSSQPIPGAQFHLELRGQAALKFQQNPVHHPQTSHHKVAFAPTVDNTLTFKKEAL